MPHRKIIERLHADATLTALVPATRIRPIKASQSDALPLIVYERDALSNEDGISDLSNTWILEMTIRIYAETYDDAIAVAEAVRDCLHGWREGSSADQVMSCRLVSESDSPESVEPGSDAIMHGITQSYRIEYRAA